MRSRRAAVAASALFLLFAASAPRAWGQGKPLEHRDAFAWKSIGGEALSPDGEWLAFVLSAMDGDPVLKVRRAREGAAVLSVRGESPVFTSDSRFVVYEAPVPEAVTDSLEREGVDADDLPADSLGIVSLDDDGLRARTVAAIESHEVAREGGWVAYVPVEEDEESADERGAESPAPGAETEEEERDAEKEAGSPLVLRNVATGAETRYEDVVEYVFAEEAAVLAFSTSTEDGSGDGVHVVDLRDGTRRPALEGEGRYKGLALAKDGRRIAFLADGEDREAERREFSLFHAAAPEWRGASLASSASAGVPPGWRVSEHGAVEFSESGARVRFGTAPPAEPEREDDALEDDRVELDVWSWRDPYLQPMQLARVEEERKRAYAAVVRLADGAVTQLATEDVPVVRFAAGADGDHVLGLSDLPYRQLLSWDGRYNDLYAIDAATGARRLLAERVKGFGGGSISPGGRYAAWWDGVARHWMVASLEGGEARAASADVPHPVWNELDDHPDLPPPYGSAGWSEGDGAFLFYDRYDVWRYDPRADAAISPTNGAGREGGIRFRHASTDADLDHVPDGPVLWSAFHERSKRAGFFRGRADRATVPERTTMEAKAFGLGAKAEDADRWLVTREDFREFPDLWVADGGDGDVRFGDMARMSDANPQRSAFRWGSAEIVEWTSNDGIPLQGILFTPDDLDRDVRHPMMVYFYERMSDGLHRHRSPRPGGASISIPFYVSRGYVVFVPDIPYEIGYPGESALDAVVPGVLEVVRRGFVDRDRIGVQGHSWGGYQIAYMITKTDLFRAAEAGAPVSNMTSAYGGIRWQSGMSRMFQYERTQSRIGGTLWEATSEYLHNSPIFFADKIRTPLLMMHNDEDGAVPWTQGIEMFVALRRLQKPVWMLNYNGEAHGLRRDANRKDWAKRMQQFFDHYLKDAPAPVWMEEGVPAIRKGADLGLGSTIPS